MQRKPNNQEKGEGTKVEESFLVTATVCSTWLVGWEAGADDLPGDGNCKTHHQDDLSYHRSFQLWLQLSTETNSDLVP